MATNELKDYLNSVSATRLVHKVTVDLRVVTGIHEPVQCRSCSKISTLCMCGNTLLAYTSRRSIGKIDRGCTSSQASRIVPLHSDGLVDLHKIHPCLCRACSYYSVEHLWNNVNANNCTFTMSRRIHQMSIRIMQMNSPNSVLVNEVRNLLVNKCRF